MLDERIEAVFENGVFRPLQPIHLEERQRVTLLVPATPPALHQMSAADSEVLEEDVGYVPLPLVQCTTIRVKVKQIESFLPIANSGG